MPVWAQIALGLVAAAAVAGCVWLSHRAQRERTRPIRRRDIPPFVLWRKTYYPKATEAEADVIECVLITLGERFADVEPTQLRPDDPLENFVLDRRPRYPGLTIDDDWSLVLGELVNAAPHEPIDLAP